MKRVWMAVRAASGLLIFAGGCSIIAGLNNEYEQESASPSGGGGGGGTGAGLPCMTPNDCPPNSDCTTWACTGGECIVTVVPDGTPVATGAIQGDCKKNVCQGGDPAFLPDDTDIVPDNDTCTEEFCNGGVKQSMKAPDGTVCGPTSKLACVNGLCEGCATDPSNCDPPTECQTVECPVNSCIYTIQEGKVLDDSFDNDCKKDVCDAQGNKATVGDTTETPSQMGDDCKVEICAMDGSIAQMNANEGQKCAGPMGVCYNDSVCVAGACAAQLKPAGMKVSDNNKVGDCKALFCDSNGGTMEGPDDTDLPTDANMGDCSVPTCSNGVPGTAAAMKGDTCTTAMNGKCCGTNCCANATGGVPNYCDKNDMCCSSNKTCNGVCCMSSTASCVNNLCCETGNACNSVCCPTTHACDNNGACCPSMSRCSNGTCCPNGQMCKPDNTCM